MKKFRFSSKGFTLVELLIVISLLAALALIVIAAINPLEQANRTRDTRFRTDSGSIVSALDRYFATRSQFPWVTTGVAATNDESFGFLTSSDVGVGVCGNATCSTDGELISSLELKGEFKNRDFIKSGGGSDDTKKIFIGKASGALSSVYACYIPLSKSNRDGACTNNKVYTINAADGSRSAVAAATCTGATWNNTWMVCVPE